MCVCVCVCVCTCACACACASVCYDISYIGTKCPHKDSRPVNVDLVGTFLVLVRKQAYKSYIFFGKSINAECFV